MARVTFRSWARTHSTIAQLPQSALYLYMRGGAATTLELCRFLHADSKVSDLAPEEITASWGSTNRVRWKSAGWFNSGERGQLLLTAQGERLARLTVARLLPAGLALTVAKDTAGWLQVVQDFAAEDPSSELARLLERVSP